MEQPALLDTATEEAPDRMRSSQAPYSVWIERCFGDELVDRFDVDVRRPDGSLLTVMGGLRYTDACRVHARVEEAIDLSEPWVLQLVDISAGKLRG